MWTAFKYHGVMAHRSNIIVDINSKEKYCLKLINLVNNIYVLLSLYFFFIIFFFWHTLRHQSFLCHQSFAEQVDGCCGPFTRPVYSHFPFQLTWFKVHHLCCTFIATELLASHVWCQLFSNPQLLFLTDKWVRLSFTNLKWPLFLHYFHIISGIVIDRFSHFTPEIDRGVHCRK